MIRGADSPDSELLPLFRASNTECYSMAGTIRCNTAVAGQTLRASRWATLYTSHESAAESASPVRVAPGAQLPTWHKSPHMLLRLPAA